jgi:fluoride exporter
VRVRDVALVSAGGVVGALARYGAIQLAPVGNDAFPSTTLAVNLVGAFLLGVLLEVLVRRAVPEHWLRLLLGIGVLGAFTTFSTLATEVVVLARDGRAGVAIGYAAASIAGGVVAVLGGLRVAGWRALSPVPAEGES